jgi:6-phospho-beta-glucosidase
VASGNKVVTVLGGGSFFTPSFIGTMVQKPDIWANTEVRLHDPDTERVALVKAFCEKYTARKKVPLTLVPQPDLDRALDGADFVIATFRIGGVRALHLDESIPPRFGYMGDETAGPGGMFMAIRTVPVLMDVARRMTRLCPQAWLLNYANPTHFVTAGVTRTSRIKCVGLCDNYVAPMGDLGWLLEIAAHRSIRERHAGYNHCNWVYSATYQGRDLLQELRDLDVRVRNERMSKASERWQWCLEKGLALFELTGWFPVATSHSMPYFYHAEHLERQLARAGTPHTFAEEHGRKNWDMLKSQLTDYQDETADQVARTQHGGAHADLAIGVASALAADTGEEYPVNMPQGTAVPGFAPETVIEVCARINKTGCTPVPVPPFPPVLQAHQQLLFAYKNLVMEGILEKNREKFLAALLIHPFTSSFEKARQLCRAMWEEEHDVLGTYWD